MWHTWGRGEVLTGFWLGGPKARDHWEDLGVGWEDNIKMDLGEIGIDRGTGFGWLRIGSSGGFL
jgi:hypothetical protein